MVASIICTLSWPSPLSFSDAFTDGRRFRVLTVVDDHTRESPALIADTSLSGRPLTVVGDNGTEFIRLRILGGHRR